MSVTEITKNGRADAAFSTDIIRPPPRIDGELLPAADRRKVLFDWNATRTEYRRESCFHQLFEEQVERSPDAIAVEGDGARLSYRELNARANRLAHHLRKRGVAAEVLVGVCLEQSPELVVALLAVLKAGGAYVPLDPSYPRERLEFMVADSGMKLLLTQESAAPNLPASAAPLLCLDSLGSAALPESNPNSAVGPENLAYVIYTSGSTGKPKGVMIPQRCLVNYLTWATSAYEVAAGNGAPVHSSISFDLTITGLFAPLLVGRAVCMVRGLQGVGTLGNLLRAQENFSLLKITPAHLELLRRQLPPARAAVAARFFVIGGEALPGHSLVWWQENAPQTVLANEYGPTETVVGCCVYFARAHERFDGAVPIGRPIANTQLYVLDSALRPVAIGAIGELYIGGDGVARGYLNRPELTAQKFIANPFAAEDAHASPTIYKTGDRVRYLPDGNLMFVGRVDEQIKLRSYRIEPAEIEAALAAHPEVENAVVMAHENSVAGKCLLAYILPQDTTMPPAAELRQFLKNVVPRYMIPSAFIAVREFPLTSNGKIDRAALPPPALPVVDCGDTGPISATSDREARLIGIWERLLQRPVRSDDDFFELGGHSLLAVRLVGEINEAFGSELDGLTLYQHPSIRALLGLLDDGVTLPGKSKLVSLRSGHGGAPLFFLNAPLEFVRLSSLMTGPESLQVSDFAFGPGVLEAALRYDCAAYPTLEEMIDPHVNIILEQNLAGPCFLAGYSSYGTVAFEVAHRLMRAGKKVEAIFLFDADMKPPPWKKMKILLVRHTRNTLKTGLPYLLNTTRDRFQRHRAVRDTMAGAPASPTPDASLSNGQISWRVFQRIWDHALRDYRAKPLDCRGVLFRADVSIYGDVHDFDGCLGWRDLFERGFEVIAVPGDHVTMWQEPQVSALGDLWEGALQKLRGAAPVMSILAAVACGV